MRSLAGTAAGIVEAAVAEAAGSRSSAGSGMGYRLAELSAVAVAGMGCTLAEIR